MEIARLLYSEEALVVLYAMDLKLNRTQPQQHQNPL